MSSDDLLRWLVADAGRRGVIGAISNLGSIEGDGAVMFITLYGDGDGDGDEMYGYLVLLPLPFPDPVEGVRGKGLLARG